MSGDDATLLLEVRGGNERAARELWARFGPRLVALAQGLLRGSGAEGWAMDCVQSVLVRVLELEPAQVSAVRDVGAFLARATRNAALNHLRTRGRATRREAGLSPAGEQGTTRAAAHDPVLWGALDTLPEAMREVVLLRHAAGLTFDQVALSLDEPRGTVTTRYRRAIELLQKQLGFVEGIAGPLAARGGMR